MMYELTLQRLKEHKDVVDLKGRKENSTLGVLTLRSERGEVLFRGCSCENDGPSTDEPMKDKRIVSGSYTLEWSKSSKNGNKSLGKWQNKVIWVKRDAKFDKRLIRIHVGNFPTDTEGCILVGETSSPKGCVNSSVSAITKLFNAIDKVGIENVKLVIKEIS